MLYSQFSKHIFVAAYIYSCHLLTRPTFRAFGNSYQVMSTWRWTGECSDIQQSTRMQLWGPGWSHLFMSAGEKNITCPHAFYVEKLDCSKFEGLASNIWVWAAALENPSSSPAPLYPARPWGHWTIAPNMPVLKVAYVTSSVIHPHLQEIEALLVSSHVQAPSKI